MHSLPVTSQEVTVGPRLSPALSSGLWGAGAVSSCLTPGPRMSDGGKAVMVQSVRPPSKAGKEAFGVFTSWVG